MGVLDGGPHATRGREVSGVFVPIGLNVIFIEMYLTYVWKVENIFIQTVQRWNWCFIGFLKM